MKNYVLILASMFLISCGARKVNKEEKIEDKTTIETVKQVDSTKEEAKTEIKYNIETCEVEVIPIDSTKEFVVDGKKYFNARIRIKKNKDNTLYTKENKVSKTSQKQSNKLIKETKKEKVKAIDKKPAISWRFYLIFWILILLLIIRLYYKFKDRLF